MKEIHGTYFPKLKSVHLLTMLDHLIIQVTSHWVFVSSIDFFFYTNMLRTIHRNIAILKIPEHDSKGEVTHWTTEAEKDHIKS